MALPEPPESPFTVEVDSGEREHRSCDGVGVDVERVLVDVADQLVVLTQQVVEVVVLTRAGEVVTRLVVARVVRRACDAAVDGRLVRGLRVLGSGEQTTCRDADSDERAVVGAPGPSGCRFHPRCPVAFDRCPTVDPPLFDVGPGHGAACLLHEPGTRVSR